MKKIFFVSLLISLLVLGMTAAAYFYFFMPNNKMVPAFDEGKLNLEIEGALVEAKDQPKIVDEEILLPIDIVKKYFDPNIFWDDKLKKVTITTKDKVIRMKTDNLNALINNKPLTLKIPVSEENSVIYIPIEFLSDFYNIEINYLKNNNVIIIDYKNHIEQIAEPIGPDAVIRNGRSIRYPIIKKLDINTDKPQDNTLRIFEEYDKWYKVRTQDGEIGYIEKQFVVVKTILVNELPKQGEETVAWKPDKGKISVAWDMMYEKRPIPVKEKKIDGLDVISPTWFQVVNEQGTLINRADAKYVEWAHKNGYKVWALLSNDSSDPDMTHKLLNNTDSRDNVIRLVLTYASLYKLDGINIDFENIDIGDKGALTQFVREITPLFKEQGLIVTMDVSPPDGSENWSQCYDRTEIGKVVDYVMLMAYDQSWPEFGPNAQVTWVEKTLTKVLSMVPKEKLLLGLPMYTRIWKEETDKNGKVKKSSTGGVAIETARKAIKDNNATVVWDDKSGQFYSEYKKDDITYKVWLEDENSINLKSSLVQKYKLAGTAAWSRNDSDQTVWSVLNSNLKLMDNYQDWKLANNGKRYVYK